MFFCPGEAGTEARYRFRTWICYIFVLALIAIAFASPVVAAFVQWMPTGETRGSWLQRSGAVTTLFSFIAGAMAVFTSGQLYTPGFFGDARKLNILKEFRYHFRIVETLIFLLSLVGTVIWGYGDLILRWFLLPP